MRRHWRMVAVLLLLAGASVALAAWAWMQVRAPLQVAEQGELLLPRLGEQLGDVAQLAVRRKGAQLLLTRTEEGLWVAEPAGWPVEGGQVRSVLLTLAQMRKVRPATALPQRYALIGVGDPARDENSAAVLVRDAEGRVLAHVLLGQEAEGWLGGGREAQFVRLADEQQAWLVEGRVRASTALQDWADTTLLALPVEQLAEVIIRHADGEVLRLAAEGRDAPGARGGEKGKTTGAQLRLADAPPGSKVREGRLKQLQAVLGSLRFRAVVPADADEVRHLREVAIVKARLGDGLAVQLHVLRLQKDGPQAGADRQEDGRQQEKAAAQWWLRGQVLQAGSDEKRAQRLRRHFKGRVFRVYDEAGAALASRLEDVLQVEVQDLRDVAPGNGAVNEEASTTSPAADAKADEAGDAGARAPATRAGGGNAGAGDGQAPDAAAASSSHSRGSATNGE